MSRVTQACRARAAGVGAWVPPTAVAELVLEVKSGAAEAAVDGAAVWRSLVRLRSSLLGLGT